MIHKKLSNVAQGTHAGLLSGVQTGSWYKAAVSCNSPAQVQHSVVVQPCLELLPSLWLLGNAVHCAPHRPTTTTLPSIVGLIDALLRLSFGGSGPQNLGHDGEAGGLALQQLLNENLGFEWCSQTDRQPGSRGSKPAAACLMPNKFALHQTPVHYQTPSTLLVLLPFVCVGSSHMHMLCPATTRCFKTGITSTGRHMLLQDLILRSAVAAQAVNHTGSPSIADDWHLLPWLLPGVLPLLIVLAPVTLPVVLLLVISVAVSRIGGILCLVEPQLDTSVAPQATCSKQPAVRSGTQQRTARRGCTRLSWGSCFSAVMLTQGDVCSLVVQLWWQGRNKGRAEQTACWCEPHAGKMSDRNANLNWQCCHWCVDTCNTAASCSVARPMRQDR